MPFRDNSWQDRYLFVLLLGLLVLGMLGCSPRSTDYSSVIVGTWVAELASRRPDFPRDQGRCIYMTFEFCVGDTVVVEARVIDRAILRDQGLKATYVVNGDQLTMHDPERTWTVQLESFDGKSVSFHFGDCVSMRLRRVQPGD